MKFCTGFKATFRQQRAIIISILFPIFSLDVAVNPKGHTLQLSLRKIWKLWKYTKQTLISKHKLWWVGSDRNYMQLLHENPGICMKHKTWQCSWLKNNVKNSCHTETLVMEWKIISTQIPILFNRLFIFLHFF